MAAKDIMGKPSSQVRGEGTRVAEYIETPVEKRCGTC